MIEGLSGRYEQMAEGSRKYGITGAGRLRRSARIPAEKAAEKLDHGIIARSPCRVVFTDRTDFKTITEAMPHLTSLRWLNSLVDAAINREWIESMGRGPKVAHAAHLIVNFISD